MKEPGHLNKIEAVLAPHDWQRIRIEYLEGNREKTTFLCSGCGAEVVRTLIDGKETSSNPLMQTACVLSDD